MFLANKPPEEACKRCARSGPPCVERQSVGAFSASSLVPLATKSLRAILHLHLQKILHKYHSIPWLVDSGCGYISAKRRTRSSLRLCLRLGPPSARKQTKARRNGATVRPAGASQTSPLIFSFPLGLCAAWAEEAQTRARVDGIRNPSRPAGQGAPFWARSHLPGARDWDLGGSPRSPMTGCHSGRRLHRGF